MKRSVENWYYNLKLNENWRSYATLKLSYLKIMEVAISTRLEPAVPSISTNANSRGSIYHYTREIILIFLERGDLGEPDLLVSQAKFWHVHILYPLSLHCSTLWPCWITCDKLWWRKTTLVNNTELEMFSRLYSTYLFGRVLEMREREERWRRSGEAEVAERRGRDVAER